MAPTQGDLTNPKIRTAHFKKEGALNTTIEALSPTDQALIQDIGELLCLNEGDAISLFRPKRVGPSDFAFAVLTRSNGEKSFVKLASTEDTKTKLRNEGAKAGATEVAAALGYPTIGIKTHYIESSVGIGVCEFEYLDFSQGESILNSLEARAKVSDEYGPLLADIIGPRIGIALPPSIDISGLQDLDSSYGTIDNFFQSFNYDCNIVLQSTLLEEAGVDPKVVEALFQEGKEILLPLAEHADSSTMYYFCGNDIALSNMFFTCKPENYNGKRVIFYDWEWAGKTHNQVVAFAVDMRTLVRLRPNVSLQENLIRALFRYSEDTDRTYILLRGGIISQTAFEGKINVRVESPYHSQGVDVLKALSSTLLLVDVIYHEFAKKPQN